MKSFLPFFALLILLEGCKNQPPEVDLIVTNVNVIDVISGRIINCQDVHIKDSIIIDITDAKKNDIKAKQYLDGTRKYLIPALWDMHVHIQDSTYLKMFLNYGILDHSTCL